MEIQKTSEIFYELKNILQKYSGSMEKRSEESGKYELYGKKKVKIGKKSPDNVFFSSIITQKDYVGLYFFPIYTHPTQFNDLPADLKKSLKGKSCFHVKSNDPVMLAHIDQLLQKGLEIYKKEGWVE